MKQKVIKTDIGWAVDSDCFAAKDTLECGQVFRFISLEGGYQVFSSDKTCLLAQDAQHKNRTLIITEHPDYFYRYFDLDTDYQKIYQTLGRFSEFEGVKSGIHILRQDLFECIISFIISANNNIPRIKAIIQQICVAFGTKMHDYYAFPTPNQLEKATADDFRAFGAGYRAEYLSHTVSTLNKTDILQRLPQMDYPSALKTLLTLKGVGKKVADCVCLFGLGLTECYPADTWISKADGMDAKKARQRGMARYGKLAGYAQQLRFYNERENSIKVQKIVGFNRDL